MKLVDYALTLGNLIEKKKEKKNQNKRYFNFCLYLILDGDDTIEFRIPLLCQHLTLAHFYFK